VIGQVLVVQAERPEVTTSRRWGHRCATRQARASPFIDSGMSMSVNRAQICGVLSRMVQAASAVAASSTMKPASSNMSTATMRTMPSSSTTSTTADVIGNLVDISKRKCARGPFPTLVAAHPILKRVMGIRYGRAG